LKLQDSYELASKKKSSDLKEARYFDEIPV